MSCNARIIQMTLQSAVKPKICLGSQMFFLAFFWNKAVVVPTRKTNELGLTKLLDVKIIARNLLFRKSQHIVVSEIKRDGKFLPQVLNKRQTNFG